MHAAAPAFPDLHDAMLEDVNRAIDKLTFGAGGRDAGSAEPPRFARIVVGYDGSHEGDLALAWAREIGRNRGAKVVVVSVYSPPAADLRTASGFAFYPGYAAALEEVQERLRRCAESGAAKVRAAGVETESVFASGRPGAEIERVARAHEADLVILGSRGRGRTLRALLGGTTSVLLDRVPASVLVARTPPPARRILAATDGSRAAARAVAWALLHARTAGADVVVQHVLPYPEGSENVPAPAFLRDVADRLGLQARDRVSYRLEAGSPSARIVDLAEETEAGLVVVGSRGLGRVAGRLLGSVSRRVVSETSASVLVVKAA